MTVRLLALAVLEHVTRGELTGDHAPAVRAVERLLEALRAKVRPSPSPVAHVVLEADEDEAPPPARIDPYACDRAWR